MRTAKNTTALYCIERGLRLLPASRGRKKLNVPANIFRHRTIKQAVKLLIIVSFRKAGAKERKDRYPFVAIPVYYLDA